MSDQKKSMIVVGGGPGGYTAAFAAAKAGMAVTLVECAELGGTCLNNGCIPTKTIKSSAEALEIAQQAVQFGVKIEGGVSIDPQAVYERKERVCATLRSGLEKTCAALGVTLVRGKGRLLGGGAVEVTGNGASSSLSADYVILATGSHPVNLPGLAADHKHILTSDGTLLGAHMAGAHATDLIAETTLALRMGASINDIATTIHAHPTLAEAIGDAALRMEEE